MKRGGRELGLLELRQTHVPAHKKMKWGARKLGWFELRYIRVPSRKKNGKSCKKVGLVGIRQTRSNTWDKSKCLRQSWASWELRIHMFLRLWKIKRGGRVLAHLEFGQWCLQAPEKNEDWQESRARLDLHECKFWHVRKMKIVAGELG